MRTFRLPRKRRRSASRKRKICNGFGPHRGIDWRMSSWPVRSALAHHLRGDILFIRLFLKFSQFWIQRGRWDAVKSWPPRTPSEPASYLGEMKSAAGGAWRPTWVTGNCIWAGLSWNLNPARVAYFCSSCLVVVFFTSLLSPSFSLLTCNLIIPLVWKSKFEWQSAVFLDCVVPGLDGFTLAALPW